jgi:hypothetical protein
VTEPLTDEELADWRKDADRSGMPDRSPLHAFLATIDAERERADRAEQEADEQTGESVRRDVARLLATIDALTAERDTWRQRAEEAEEVAGDLRVERDTWRQRSERAAGA